MARKTPKKRTSNRKAPRRRKSDRRPLAQRVQEAAGVQPLPPPAPAVPLERDWDADLTARQRLFILNLIASRDFNATQAAIDAGYSPRTAKQIASELLTKPDLRALLEHAIEMRARRVEVKADEVLRELLRIATVDPARAVNPEGGLLPLHEMPEDVRRAVSGIEVEELFEGRGRDRKHVGTLRKVKFWPKHEALRDLGRHLKLWTDLVETKDGDLSDEERLARVHELERKARERAAAQAPPETEGPDAGGGGV